MIQFNDLAVTFVNLEIYMVRKLLVRDGRTPSFVGSTVMKMNSNSLKVLTNHVAFGMLLVTYLFSLTLMT